MSDIGEDIAKAAIMGALGIAADVVSDQIKTRRDLAKRALEVAAGTGVALSELWEDLQDVDAARAERMLRASQFAAYGQSEGDGP